MNQLPLNLQQFAQFPTTEEYVRLKDCSKKPLATNGETVSIEQFFVESAEKGIYENIIVFPHEPTIIKHYIIKDHFVAYLHQHTFLKLPLNIGAASYTSIFETTPFQAKDPKQWLSKHLREKIFIYPWTPQLVKLTEKAHYHFSEVLLHKRFLQQLEPQKP